ITGTVRADERAPSGVELSVNGVEVVGDSAEYPITPKEHGTDFLFDNRHLYLRHRGPWAILRIRDEVQRAVHDFYSERDFIRFDSPLFMPTAVEGTTNLFEIDLFDEDKAYLAQTGQLYAEAGAMAHGKVYTFGPTFRAEKSKTRRHLIEFWMIEPEMAFYNHEDSLVVQEQYVEYLVKNVLEHCKLDLEALGRDTTALEKIKAPFPRISYTEAIDLLHEKG